MLKSGLALVLFAAATPTVADHIIALPQAELPWTTTNEGAEFAALQGDRFAGSYMAMVRLPAGLASPPHVKTADMFGVVLEGTFVHTTNGERGRQLGPGSYYHIPAGLPHVSACVSDATCIAFLYQDGAFDFNVVEQ